MQMQNALIWKMNIYDLEETSLDGMNIYYLDAKSLDLGDEYF